MPYIPENDKESVREGRIRNGGDLNFKITEAFQNYFMENGARYQQIHEIGAVVVAVTAQNADAKIVLVESLTPTERVLAEYLMDLSHSSPLRAVDDIAAIYEAQAEFRRRVVAPYEDSCVKKNGDVMRLDLKEKLDSLK